MESRVDSPPFFLTIWCGAEAYHRAASSRVPFLFLFLSPAGSPHSARQWTSAGRCLISHPFFSPQMRMIQGNDFRLGRNRLSSFSFLSRADRSEAATAVFLFCSPLTACAPETDHGLNLQLVFLFFFPNSPGNIGGETGWKAFFFFSLPVFPAIPYRELRCLRTKLFFLFFSFGRLRSKKL